MAATEVAINLLGVRKTSSNANFTSDLDTNDLREAFQKAVYTLSQVKAGSVEKCDWNTIKGFIMLLIFDVDGVLCSSLSAINDDFYGSLISKILPVQEEYTSKRKPCVVFKGKLLMRILLKECSPFISPRSSVILDQIQQNLINKYNMLVLLSTLLHSCVEREQFMEACQFVMKLMQNSSVSSRVHRFCISLICSLENHTLLATESNVENFEAATRKLCNWLIYTSSQQALSSPQHKEQVQTVMKKKVTVQEIDGTPSRDFFTVLNIASSLNTDHLHNIHAFSMLQNWLLVLQNHDAEIWNNVLKKVPRSQRPSSAIPNYIGQSSFYLASSTSSESSAPASLSSSLSSLNSFLYVENEGDKSKDWPELVRTSPTFGTPPSLYEGRSLRGSSSLRKPSSVSTPKKADLLDRDSSFEGRKLSVSSLASVSSGGLTLKNASVRYCLRLLGQAEKIPHRSEDKVVLTAAVIEAVRVLTLLCQQDESLVKKVFPEIKRVHSRILGSSSDARRLYPADIQFFVEHYDSMIYNTEELVQSYLRTVPSQLYMSSSACFEVLDFCLRNFQFFQRFPFLSKFFPNLFKFVAWHPRSFLSEFLELLPLFVTESTAGEVFHSIIDIPCTAAMLELTQHNIVDKVLEENLKASFGDEGEFLSKSHRKISDFFLRSESGGAETIDKLDKVYIALKPLSKKTRVMVCCQVVPILLRKFFQCVNAQANHEMPKRLFPSMLERIFTLFPDTTLETGVRNVLSEQFIRICCQCPQFICTEQDDILYLFKKVRSQCPGLDSVLTSLVYCIGEFSIRPGVCSMEHIAKYYELIETLIYETKTSLFCNDDFPICPRMISSLISTAGKLAAFSQDFVPKTVLSLTKLVNTEWKMSSCRISQREFEVVMSRATEVVNVLRLPNVSPAILCSGADVEPWHLDANRSRQLKVQAMARRETKTASFRASEQLGVQPHVLYLLSCAYMPHGFQPGVEQGFLVRNTIRISLWP